MLVGDKPACEQVVRQAKERHPIHDDKYHQTDDKQRVPDRATCKQTHLSLDHRLKVRIIFLILGELNLNFRLRLPWLAFLEASAREGYGIQECRPVLLGKRQYACLLLCGVDLAGFRHRTTAPGVVSQLAAVLFELSEIAVALFSAPRSIRVKADVQQICFSEPSKTNRRHD
jgi:hypothetical protein